LEVEEEDDDEEVEDEEEEEEDEEDEEEGGQVGETSASAWGAGCERYEGAKRLRLCGWLRSAESCAGSGEAQASAAAAGSALAAAAAWQASADRAAGRSRGSCGAVRRSIAHRSLMRSRQTGAVSAAGS
jgi:hypothetical protein